MTKILEINHKEVILDQRMFEILRTFILPQKRRYELPLAINGSGRADWGYTYNGLRRSILLHHLIVGCPIRGLVVDHINRNPLDNRLQNLRVVTRRENALNSKASRKLSGMRYVERVDSYAAQITHNYRKYHLGYFKTAEEAHTKYNWARDLIESGQMEKFLTHRLEK